MSVQLRRVYEMGGAPKGARFLVERLWPRGMKKGDLGLTAWVKEVAPSDSLRRWFAHDPAKWTEFRRRYTAELDGQPEAWQGLLEAARSGDVTLLYSARDTEPNNAVVLRDFLERQLQKASWSSTPAASPVPTRPG